MKNATNLYAVSTSVGSGKTHAAIRYMNDGTLCNQNFIYVAPTKLLLEQTAQNLRQAIFQRTGRDALHVHVIHSDCRHGWRPSASSTRLPLNKVRLSC